MAATQFFQVQVGQKFHCGKDKDGSMLVWKKTALHVGVCVEARGRFASRWVGVEDNFFSFDRVWVL